MCLCRSNRRMIELRNLNMFFWDIAELGQQKDAFLCLPSIAGGLCQRVIELEEETDDWSLQGQVQSHCAASNIINRVILYCYFSQPHMLNNPFTTVLNFFWLRINICLFTLKCIGFINHWVRKVWKWIKHQIFIL